MVFQIFNKHGLKGDERAIAIVSNSERISYSELNRRTKNIANYLRNKNIKSGSLVGIYAGRSADCIIALVGVIRSGASFTVIEERTISADSLRCSDNNDLACVLTTEEYRAGLKKIGLEGIIINKIYNLVEVDEKFKAEDVTSTADADDPAYVVFTSGSTGKPKGVVVTRSNIEHYVASLQQRLNISESLSYAHVSSLSADLGYTCVFLSLMTKGTLHVIDDETRKDPLKLCQYINEEKIDFIKITPSHWQVILAAMEDRDIKPRKLKFLVLGGECLSLSLAAKTLDADSTEVLANHYGPTETTIGVSVFTANHKNQINLLKTNTVPIGMPFGATKIFVKDKNGCFKRHSAKGELHIAGPSLAKGYLKNDEATNNAFIYVSIDEKITRLYKTGDHVELDEKGVIEYIGRIDRQVKHKGYRIELEYIEAKITAITGISQAYACLRHAKGRSHLVAVVKTMEDCFSTGALQSSLSAELPYYMVPDIFIIVSEFPIKDSGKVDSKRLLEIIEADEKRNAASRVNNDIPFNPGDEVIRDMVDIWNKHLYLHVSSIDDDFYALGGDSLLAIQIISDLQKKGHNITANVFLNNLTVRKISEAINEGGCDSAEKIVPITESGIFSSAQEWFFEQNFNQPNHWNQAILLQVESDIDVHTLSLTIDRVMEMHPMLRTRYTKIDGKWRAITKSRTAGYFNVSNLADATDEETHAHIYAVSNTLNIGMSLDSGDIFKIHLFKLNNKPDQLLFLCHHLSIDTISWRIILGDLSSIYCSYVDGIDLNIPKQTITYWNWVDHIKNNKDKFYRGLSFWENMKVNPDTEYSSSVDDNEEKHSQSLWFSLSKDDTDFLKNDAAIKYNATSDQILFGVFSYIICNELETRKIFLELESYGRKVIGNNLDVSRTVGWFTSAFPLLLNASTDNVLDNIQSVKQIFNDIPDLGIGYGLFKESLHSINTQLTPLICYNYLGEFNYQVNHGLSLVPSVYKLSPVRGGDNSRVHNFKLTAKIINRQLVVDLSYSTKKYEPKIIEKLYHNFCVMLLELLESKNKKNINIISDSGSSTGLVSYLPKDLQRDAINTRSKNYKNIFLTGATGYLGVYVLNGLLKRTDAKIFCLIRKKDGVSTIVRMHEIYKWHFGDVGLKKYENRIIIVEGDIEKVNFGLNDSAYKNLCSSIDSIYHFAADTRLFGSSGTIETTNVISVMSVIKMAGALKSKELHYMSTLAVSGVNRSVEPVVFNEHCLDIGQHFQNAYELSKYKSELLMQEFINNGGAGYIYRAGNVSGDSNSGRFQSNAADNRFVQFLRAITKLGKLPKSMTETIVLAPVDIVADSIISLSLSAIACRVYHVDSVTEFQYEYIFSQIVKNGFPMERTACVSFKELLSSFGDPGDLTLAIGIFWANREHKNIIFDHSYTRSLLSSLGHKIVEVDKSWVNKYIRDLIDRGILDHKGEKETADPVEFPDWRLNSSS